MKNIMKIAFCAAFFPTWANATDFSTPEAAIKTLEAAYSSKNMENILNVRDFQAEAQLMMNDIKPEFAKDKALMQQLEEVLYLGSKQEIESDIPDFSQLKCVLEDKQVLKNGVVQFNEVCTYPDKGTSEQLVHAYKGKNGWRYVSYNPKK